MNDRPDRLAAAANERGLDLLLVTDSINLRWLTGFAGTNGAAFCGPAHRDFLTDFRYTELAESTLTAWDVHTVRGEWIGGVAARLVERLGSGGGRVGYEDDHLTVRTLRKLEEALAEASGSGRGGAAPAVTLEPAGGLTQSLRRRKDPAELAAITAAAELTDATYRQTLEQGLTGRTEAEVARTTLAWMREQGGEPSFPPIVAAGPNGALPHAVPGERRIASGDLVVFDMGAELDGYCSDCTRTFAAGAVTPEAGETYQTVLRAQLAALEGIRAGITGMAADALARDPIAAAGHAEQFGHGLGHGVGMEVHEAPRLSPLSTDTLREGDVVTVEPGVYLPGRYGIRIEDLVAVTAEGHRNLSGLPKALEPAP